MCDSELAGWSKEILSTEKPREEETPAQGKFRIT